MSPVRRPSGPSVTGSNTSLATQPSRRPRIDYSRQEERHLVEGVSKYGTAWNTILRLYPFNRQRTTADLKEKYARLQKKKVCHVLPRVQFFVGTGRLV